jgi:hypothetical protein
MSQSIVVPVDWSLCIFCQVSNTKHALVSITTSPVSDRILQSAVLDNRMRTHLAGIIDLMAAEGKYHNICLTAFK